MKKIYLSSLVALGLCVNVMAQNVGIGTTTPSDQLHTTGSVRFQNLSGTGDRQLMVDTAGRLKIGSQGTVFRSNASNSNITIPDNGYTNCNGAYSEIEVNGINTTTPNIALRVNITHSYVGDLLLVLGAPNNNDVICLANVFVNNSGDDFTSTIFTDGGATFPSGATGAPFTGIYAPAGTTVVWCNSTISFFTNKSSFASFGSNVNGKWKLRVFDRANGDVGTLVNWEMTFDGAATLTQENTIAGNFSIKSGSPAAGKVLTASNTSGHTQWEYPAPYNTAFKASLITGSVNVSSSTATTTLPFDVNTAYIGTSFDDGGNFLSGSGLHYYRAPSSGVYQFHVKLDLIGNTIATTATQMGEYTVRLKAVGGATIAEYTIPTVNGTVISSMMFSCIERLSKDDLIRVEVDNTTGANIPLDMSSKFWGVRLY